MLADGRMKFLALAILGGTFTGSVGYADSNWNPTNGGAYTVDCIAFQYVFPVVMEGVEVVATVVNSGSSKGMMFRATAYTMTVARNTDVTGIPHEVVACPLAMVVVAVVVVTGSQRLAVCCCC